MSLCHICLKVLNLDESVPSRPLTVPHHSSITEFLDAVNKRCHLCWLGYRHLRLDRKLKLDELASQEAADEQISTLTSGGRVAHCLVGERQQVTRITWKVAQSVRNKLPQLILGLEIDGVHAKATIACGALFLIPTTGMSRIKLTRFSRPLELPSNTGSPISLQLVVGWLNHCVLSHSKCSVSGITSTFRPTRLIDIGNVQGQFQVIPGNETVPNEPYITLSYLWGTQRDMMLTQDNQDQLRAGKPVEALPRTFKEAIIVARYIGVRFLWIDCLCIIQRGDDGRDWDAESGRMNLVYQHAYCNISADDASETDGLFFNRDLDFYRRVSVRTREKGGAVVDWTSVDRDMWATEVNNSPLNRRGWVFQERLLAPRVIHFCRQEIFWECRERFCCESFPESQPSAEFLDLSQTVSLRQLPSELWEGCDWDGDENFPLEDLPYEVWDDIIKAYTKCQFTYPSDKLVAISGVAKYTKTIIKDTYLAGMWQKRLSAELAWWMYPDRERYLFGEEPPYYAPSFSWASVKGQINSSGPFAIGILPQVQCVSIDSGPHCNTPDQPFANDVFGTPLTSSAFQLRVRGRVRSLKLRKQGDWKAIVHISAGQGISPSTVELDAWLDFHISDADRHTFEREALYLIYWRHGPEAGDYDMSGAALHCMLVRPVDQTRDQVRRIGWAIADDPEMSLMLNDETWEEVSHRSDEGKLTSVIYLI